MIVLVVLSATTGVLRAQTTAESTQAPVNALTKGGFVCNWLIVGPFPNPKLPEPLPDGTYGAGFKTDYLSALGGEPNAVITTATTVAFQDEDGNDQVATVYRAKMKPHGIVDIDGTLAPEDLDYKVAYAFCYIRSEKAQKAWAYFGSDDGARVYANGKLVNDHPRPRGCFWRDEWFALDLQKGLNPILVKVSELKGAWVFVLEVFDAESDLAIQTKFASEEELREFQRCELRPEGRWGFMFAPGEFPKIDWESPTLVEKIAGKFPLKVRWFDGQMNEVKIAEAPGRYAAVIEGTTSNGVRVQRAMTLYCRPKDWHPWIDAPKAYVEYLPKSPIDKDAWGERKESIARWAGRSLLNILQSEPHGAVLMSYFSEMKPLGRPPTKVETPEILNDDYHLALKRKLLGVENKYPPLRMPRKIEGKPASVLHYGTPEEAGVKPGTTEKIRAVCKRWYAESKEPFVVLIARHGVIVIHEAFGEGPRSRVTIDTPMDIASITKAMTGMMFAQFVDQGLIGIDDPVGKFLPGFSTEGEEAITLRHCFTHTTELDGHYEYGGMHNPYLENVIAHELFRLSPGQLFRYNGMGYDLAGKAMEMVSGKSIFRLMHENFFNPLGVKNTTIDDLACATMSTAEDLGKIGQLLLNKGSYADLEFFSAKTFQELLPRRFGDLYPKMRKQRDIEKEWGIALHWVPEAHPDAGKEGVPADKVILGRRMLGHGAGSSAIFCVDLDNDLVITQSRNQAGEAYEKYRKTFFLAIEEALAD